ncbi:MAG: 2-dehydropantoate 2-reductase [Spirochaetes bacterium]|nr:MAG: 2-dehydropantoate 2-reductase [Spirochaetota bacterium]
MIPGIAGGGAMGALFAYFFQRAGMEWRLYETSDVVRRSFRQGVSVKFGGADTLLAGNVSGDPGILSGCGMVLLFVKSYSTADAIAAIAPSLDRDAVVVSLQNGLGNAQVIARAVGTGRLVYGSTVIGAAKTDPHTVVHGGGSRVTIGGANADATGRVDRALTRAGLDVMVSATPEEIVWRKAIINAAINPLGALLDVPNGALLDLPGVADLQDAIVTEAAAVARARGLGFDTASLRREVSEVCASTAKNLCSMLQDLRAGRRTEIQAINGAIAAFGEESGIPVPYNRALTLLVLAKESASSR